MDQLLIKLGLNPDVFLPILKAQLFEPFNILAALFIICAPIGRFRFSSYIRFALIVLCLYLIFSLKLQLGLFPDVAIIEMFKVIVPVALVYWVIGLFILLACRRKTSFKTYLVLCVFTLVIFFLVSIGFYNFPLQELINFSQHIILGSPHAKLLITLPFVIGIWALIIRK